MEVDFFGKLILTSNNDAICSDRAIAFTPLRYTQSVIYEGQTEGMTASEVYYEYYLNGNFGELKNYTFSDKGTLGNSGTGAYNYKTSVEYTKNTDRHIIGLPVKVQVRGADGVLYRQTEATYDTNYSSHLTQVSQTLDAQNSKAVIDIEYDKYGNITRKTFPANYKGERMWLKYLYDRDYDMYVERVEDAFGYRSEMEDYDYRFGIPRTVRDMNGYTQETEIDNMGRITKILAPNEQAVGAPYTIQFEYHRTPPPPVDLPVIHNSQYLCPIQTKRSIDMIKKRTYRKRRYDSHLAKRGLQYCRLW